MSYDYAHHQGGNRKWDGRHATYVVGDPEVPPSQGNVPNWEYNSKIGDPEIPPSQGHVPKWEYNFKDM